LAGAKAEADPIRAAMVAIFIMVNRTRHGSTTDKKECVAEAVERREIEVWCVAILPYFVESHKEIDD
jgi:hypothetical protein